jgi:hypothetical protein
MTDGHNGSLDTTTEGDSRSRIFREIDFAEQKFRTAKARWNRWYYCGTAGSVVFPALAAVVLKLESVPTGAFKNDVAALLAAMGAVCASVLADGKIRSRWAATRRARAEVQAIRLDALGPNADFSRSIEALKAAIARYNEAVVEDS